jgi:P27 family predicted phage terminase small subunit
MAGRRPQPTKLRVLRGNPGKRPLPKAEPQPDRAMPEPPAHLGEIALQEWHALAPELHRIGVLTRVDGTALAAHCAAYELWVIARRHVESEGHVHAMENGRQLMSPWVQIGKDAASMMHKFLTEFGLTPASRSRIVAHGIKADDALEQFLARKKDSQQKERP